MQSTVTEQGRIAMAVAIAARPLHIAWGLGDEAWDSMDPLEWPSLVKATALVNEVGRRKPSVVGFVTPDDNGSIVVPVEKRVTEEGTVEVVTKRYAYSAEPTAYLYLRADFDYSDAPPPRCARSAFSWIRRSPRTAQPASSISVLTKS